MKKIFLNKIRFAQVDDEDYEHLNQFNWSVSGRGIFRYAKARIDGKTITMHRLVTKALKGEVVDHEDHDTLNNQKYNLRKCSSSNNNANKLKKPNTTSIYKGVTWSKEKKSWIAQITINYNHKFIGYYKIERNAARAYNIEAKKHHGEFALLNKVPDEFEDEPVRTTSKYHGVYWESQSKKWKSGITIDKKKKHIGYFSSEHEAAKAYNLFVKNIPSYSNKINILK